MAILCFDEMVTMGLDVILGLGILKRLYSRENYNFLALLDRMMMAELERRFFRIILSLLGILTRDILGLRRILCDSKRISLASMFRTDLIEDSRALIISPVAISVYANMNFKPTPTYHCDED